MRYHSKRLAVGDIQTHYLEAGEGPHLILLHGGEYGASAETTWKFNVGPLAKNFHVIAPDMLGYGLTDKIYNFSDPMGFRIKHIKRFLEAVGVEKATFVGNSAGGGIILKAAIMNHPPFQIARIVTICGTGGLFKTENHSLLRSYTPSVENMRKLMSLLFYDKQWLSPELVKERYQNSIIPGSWETLSAARVRRPGDDRISNNEEFIKRLSNLHMPVLIISCTHDLLNQKNWDAKLRELIKGARIYRFENSAHEPQIEEAEEFNRILTEFLLA